MNLTKKNNKEHPKASILASAISLVLISGSPLNAQSPEKKSSKEQCAGLVKAGMNDCASIEHACAGLNTDDGYESDWLWLPAGTCDKISGAHVIDPKENT